MEIIIAMENFNSYVPQKRPQCPDVCIFDLNYLLHMEVWCSCYWIQYQLNHVKTSELKHVHSRVPMKYEIKLPHQHLKYLHTITHINQRTWISTYFANSFPAAWLHCTCLNKSLRFSQEWGLSSQVVEVCKSRIFTEKAQKKWHFNSLQMYKPFLLLWLVV